MENPDFLKKKYNLHNTPEVKAAAKRTAIRSGEKVPQKPAEQIQNYLDRFTEIIERKDPEKREQGIEALKKVLYNQCVIKPEEIPEAYFEGQRRIAREQGHGDVEIGEEQKEQLTEVIIADQESSLDTWVDYLASSDATYPDWLKYFAMRNVVGMGEFDKESRQFASRSKGTTKPFPDLNREALAYVLDAVEKKQYDLHYIPSLDRNEEDEKKFEELLKTESFPKLYAWAIEKVTPASQDALTNTQGEWIKYDRNSNHIPLVQSLQGHGTGWCTAGETTAEMQLEHGDFYVYYSLDQQGKPTIPRAAIRMEGRKIAEVRGIAEQQNLDPYIGEVVQEKMKEFPDGKEYEKKAHDMKTLTVIENKTNKDKELTPEETRFLYEMDGKIQGFGYNKDPRIGEIVDKRDAVKDMRLLYPSAHPEAEKGAEISDTDLILWLAKEGQEKILTTVMEKAESFTEGDAFKLLDNDGSTIVARYLNKFVGVDGFLSEDLAFAMVETNNSYAVAKNLEKFKRADSSISDTLALKLIEGREAEAVARNLELFSNPVELVAASLKNENFVHYIIKNLANYEKIDSELLIEKLIDGGFGSEIVKEIQNPSNLSVLMGTKKNTETIRGLNENNFIKFIDADCLVITEIERVANERGQYRDQNKYYHLPIKKFSGLEEASALKLIEKKQEKTLTEALGSFHNLSKETLIKLLEIREATYDKSGNNPVNNGRGSAYGEQIASHLDSFKELDNEVAELLMKTEIKELVGGGMFVSRQYKSLAYSVVDNLEKFQGVNHVELFNKLLANNETDTLISNIDKFPEVNQQEFIDSLLEQEKIYRNRNFSDSIPKFQNIDREKLAEQLIKKGVYWMVTENLDYFSYLKPIELANRLMEKQYGMGAVANDLEKFEGIDKQAVALQIVEKGNQSDVGDLLKNLDKFNTVDYDAVFQNLMARLTDMGKEQAYYFEQYFRDNEKYKIRNLNLTPETKSKMTQMRLL